MLYWVQYVLSSSGARELNDEDRVTWEVPEGYPLFGGLWEDEDCDSDEIVDKFDSRLRKLEEDLGGFLSLFATSVFEVLHRLGNVEDKLGKCIFQIKN